MGDGGHAAGSAGSGVMGAEAFPPDGLARAEVRRPQPADPPRTAHLTALSTRLRLSHTTALQPSPEHRLRRLQAWLMPCEHAGELPPAPQNCAGTPRPPGRVTSDSGVGTTARPCALTRATNMLRAAAANGKALVREEKLSLDQPALHCLEQTRGRERVHCRSLTSLGPQGPPELQGPPGPRQARPGFQANSRGEGRGPRIQRIQYIRPWERSPGLSGPAASHQWLGFCFLGHCCHLLDTECWMNLLTFS